MIKEEFYFESYCGTNKIHAVKWVPDGEPRCILQIVHGMCEYVERYEEFAEFLVSHNIIVVGEDHLGHGKSMGNNPPGYFCEKDPDKVVVENVHILKDMIREEYPGVPYVVFGHSMGSFITRNFVHKYGAEIDGAVISATGLQPKGILAMMKVAVAVLTAFQGSRHVSKFMDKMAFGTYLKRIENPKTPYDWLSVNEENVQKYMADDQCGFIFTLNGFKTLQGLCRGLFDTEKIASIPKDLPMLFIYGDEDPVGAYGEGVEKSCQMYVDAGMEKVSKILYPGKRHELLNEDNRADVMQDVYNWITGKVLDWLDQRQV